MDQNPKKFSIRPEGSLQLQTGADGTLTASSDMPVKIDLGHIDAIGIRHLADIVSHEIKRVAGLTSHFIRLFGGGEIVLAFNEQGNIIECCGSDVLSRVVNGQELIFSKKQT